MPEDKLTVRDVAYKVKWEGGILRTLQSGLSHSEIEDKDLADLWGEAELLYSLLLPVTLKIADLVLPYTAKNSDQSKLHPLGSAT